MYNGEQNSTYLVDNGFSYMLDDIESLTLTMVLWRVIVNKTIHMKRANPNHNQLASLCIRSKE